MRWPPGEPKKPFFSWPIEAAMTAAFRPDRRTPPTSAAGLSAAIAVALVPLGLLLFADPHTGSSL
jgi:hypothetical protein